MMSVGFIAFVTVLHIIGKVRQFLGGRLGRQKGKKKKPETSISAKMTMAPKGRALTSLSLPVTDYHSQLRGL